MKDPYQILGVSVDADEALLRRRYLELVRQNPPEKCPDRFAEIREAYERVRDPVRRLERMLFEAGRDESLDEVIEELRAKRQSVRIPTNMLLSLAEK